MPSPEGKTTISGGTTATGVEVRAGELTVTGGTITGSGTEFTSTSNVNGSTTSGAGIAISQHTTQKPITVTIGSDGGGTQPTIKGKVGVAVVNTQGNSTTTDALKVDIKGGTITSTDTSDSGKAIYSTDSRVSVAGAENASFAASVTVETSTTTTDPETGDKVTTTTTVTKYYTSFNDAMNAVNGNIVNYPTITVTLLKNIDVATTISTGKEFTLDLGGKNRHNHF